MGLDVSFNRQQALDAGLTLQRTTNGTEEEIAKARADKDDPDYAEWLAQEVEFIDVPGSNLVVSNDSFGDSIIVRANKWGRIYEPLTTWLKANNITWEEF